MRKLLRFGLVSVLSFTGLIIWGLVPGGLTATSDVEVGQVANLTIQELTDSNAVEVDGIQFEILVPERVWFIPKNQPDAATPVQIGVRITNQTPTPFRFSRFFTLVPQFVGSDVQALKLGGGSDSTFPPKESDYPLAMPGQSITFFLKGRLLWRNEKLQLIFNDGFGGVISFNDLKPGRYQLRFVYANSSFTAQAYDQDIVFGRTVEGFWTGQLVTPFVEVILVHL